uniref:Cation channel sperm-associated protein subunit beta n=1 Tax=Castor canadensis TaxID=51338 RepID=A0A8B7VX65_CASCN
MRSIGLREVRGVQVPEASGPDFTGATVAQASPSDIEGDVEKSFVCSSEGYSEYNEIIKLFLSSGNMKIRCFFQSENEITSKGILGVFTSGGLAPSLGILNSTYHGIFHFDLTLANNGFFWQVEIPRENITKNTDIAATEEWLVRLTLHQGLDIYTTEGTLLDLVREPILQWTLGTKLSLTQISELYPHVVDLKVAKCPCANDVALLGFVLNSTYNGVFVGLTYSGFWNYNETTWYDMTDIIYSQLQEEHPKLTLIDMVLTNHFLVILTSLGLYVSGDLRYPSTQLINLSRADFCGFERVDYVKGRLWYNEKCFANREPFEVDYVTITFERNKTLSEASSCFYGKEPFLNWLPCIPYNVKDAKFLPTVITFLIDQEQNTGIYFFYNLTTRRISCAVSILKNDESVFQIKFPTFQFPYSFSIPTGMVFHPRSHFLYVYGNQLWISMDGGNTFELVADFYGGVIKSIYHSFYTSDIALVARNGRVYLTKAGLRRYARIGVISDKVFALYYDHLGFIHKLAPDYFDAGSEIEAFGNTRTIFGK